MSIWKVYKFENQIIAPAMVVTEDGVFVETQPVTVIPADSIEEVAAFLKESLGQSPQAAQASDLYDPEDPDRRPVLLDVLDIKSWKEFEKRSLMFTLHRHENKLTFYATGRGADGMWVVDQNKNKTFEMADRLKQSCFELASEICTARVIDAPALRLLAAPPKEIS